MNRRYTVKGVSYNVADMRDRQRVLANQILAMLTRKVGIRTLANQIGLSRAAVHRMLHLETTGPASIGHLETLLAFLRGSKTILKIQRDVSGHNALIYDDKNVGRQIPWDQIKNLDALQGMKPYSKRYVHAIDSPSRLFITTQAPEQDW